jgi:hypothetical protein
MSIVREIDEKKGTAVLMYRGRPITPELNLKDPKQLFEVLSAVINDAYSKIHDAGIE